MDILSLSTLSNAFTGIKLTSIKTKYADKRQKERTQELTDKQREHRRIVEQMQEQAEADRKAAKLSSLQAKFKNGGQLTSEEIAYMRQESPGRYEELLKQKAEAEAYEKALQNCATKEDVSQVHMVKLSQFMTEANAVCNNPTIPKGKKLEIMLKLRDRLEGITKAHTKFVNSEEYSRLPSIYDEETKPEEEPKPQENEGTPEADSSKKPLDEQNPAAGSKADEAESGESSDARAQQPAESSDIGGGSLPKSDEKTKESQHERHPNKAAKKPPFKSTAADFETAMQFISFEIEKLSGFKSKNVDVLV